MKVILKSLVFVSFFALLSACSNEAKTPELIKKTERVIVKEQIKEGDLLVEEYEFDKIQKVRHGKSTMYYPSGKIMVEQNYEDNKFHGPKTFYYESGQIMSKETYEKGEKNGPFAFYYENGNLKQEGTYNKSAIVGICKGYYETGQLKESVTFVDGWENGPFEEYSEKGSIAAKGHYIPNPDPDGVALEHGILEEYDDNGQLKTKKECENGICYTIWDAVKGDIKPNKLPIHQ